VKGIGSAAAHVDPPQDYEDTDDTIPRVLNKQPRAVSRSVQDLCLREDLGLAPLHKTLKTCAFAKTSASRRSTKR
jgi:hypothetical protein